MILALVGLSKARSAKALCDAHPGMFSNAGVAQAGMILSIIGICLGGISTLCGCGYFAIIIMALMGAAGGGWRRRRRGAMILIPLRGRTPATAAAGV